MSTDRSKRDSMSLQEATVSNMWEIAAIVEVLERKGLCPFKFLVKGSHNSTYITTEDNNSNSSSPRFPGARSEA
jgi:hypothetical protein